MFGIRRSLRDTFAEVIDIERGSRPSAVRDHRHDSAWLFGAICPQRAVGAAIVMPRVSSEVMSLHLAEIGMQVSPGAHCVLVCDGAGWHQRANGYACGTMSPCCGCRPTHRN